jgi:hypothetical protein
VNMIESLDSLSIAGFDAFGKCLCHLYLWHMMSFFEKVFDEIKYQNHTKDLQVGDTQTN